MSSIKKIGVLTGGGDAPGLNAVIRAVVKAAHNAGVQVIGLEDSFDGLIYPEKSRVAHAARRHGHPPARRHDPRHGQPRRSVCGAHHHAGGDLQLRRSRDGDVPEDRPRCARLHRRRRNARDLVRVLQEGDPARRRPEDDRQRHRRDHQLFRLRHRGELRDRRDRSAAHDSRSASPRHGGGGDGPVRGLDCAARRRRRRRGRDPDAGDSLRPRQGGPVHPRPRQAGAPGSASSSLRKARSRRAAASRSSRRRIMGTPSGSAARAPCARASSRRAPERRRATSSLGTCSAAACRPHSIARWRRGSAARRWNC